MMDGGPILTYMNHLKDDNKSAVLLTGYQVENTNSRLLMDKRKLNFYGVLQNIACDVEYFDFSAHADHSQLIEFAKNCNPEKIVLFHSDRRDVLVDPLKDVAEVYTPNIGEILNI
jgi:putative mRNA 3-end processing factor